MFKAANISFFIPAFNCAGTVAESVESIMATNFYQGDELIIVNDFSTDNTAGVLASLKQKYPLITIIDHKRNKGGAAARNTAVENASNPLVFCLDSDNVLEKNSIAPLKDFLSEQEADVAAFCEIRYFSKETSLVEEIWYHDKGVFTIEGLLSGKLNPGGSGNYLFTRESWVKAGGYSEDLGALDTWSFGFKQLMEGSKMVVQPGGYYFHRRGHESYYMRDAWNRRRSVSFRLIKLIINYVDRIHPNDIDYIFSRKGRYSWFDNLAKRPIRLANKISVDAVWQEHDLRLTIMGTLKRRAAYYKARISQIIGQR